MKHSSLWLACVAAIGLVAASAQAQHSAPSTASATSGSAAVASPAPADASSRMAPGSMSSAPDATVLSTPDSSDAAVKANAEADFRAAQMACNAKTMTDRDNCLRNAQENYIHALDESANNSLHDQ